MMVYSKVFNDGSDYVYYSNSIKHYKKRVTRFMQTFLMMKKRELLAW